MTVFYIYSNIQCDLKLEAQKEMNCSNMPYKVFEYSILAGKYTPCSTSFCKSKLSS